MASVVFSADFSAGAKMIPLHEAFTSPEGQKAAERHGLVGEGINTSYRVGFLLKDPEGARTSNFSFIVSCQDRFAINLATLTAEILRDHNFDGLKFSGVMNLAKSGERSDQ